MSGGTTVIWRMEAEHDGAVRRLEMSVAPSPDGGARAIAYCHSPYQPQPFPSDEDAARQALELEMRAHNTNQLL